METKPPLGVAVQATRVLILMGAAGSGKTTVGRQLARDLSWPFYDSDDFQPAGNVAKMSQGLALNDQDRLPWLRALHDLVTGILSGRGHGVLACSALKQNYRDTLKGSLGGIGWVYLKGTYALLEARLKARPEHFFKSDLLSTQFEILEEPEDAFTVDAAGDAAALSTLIRQAFRLSSLPAGT